MVRVLTPPPGDANARSSSSPSGIVMRTRAQVPESKSRRHHCVMPESSCLCSFIWKLGVVNYQLPLYKMLVGKRVSRCEVLSPHLADRTCLGVLGPIKGWYYYRIRHKRQQRLREVKDGPRATELPPPLALCLLGGILQWNQTQGCGTTFTLTLLCGRSEGGLALVEAQWEFLG